MNAAVDVSTGARVRLFNTLALETSAQCNRRCVFCPVHAGERPDEQMPFGLIIKAVH